MYNVKINIISTWAYKFVAVVHSLSCVWLFETPWTIAHQAPLSSTVSQSLLNLMTVESVMLSNHLTISPSATPSPFAINLPQHQGLFQGVGSSHQSTGASASALVLLMNIRDWFPLGLTSLISLQPKGLSKVFSNTTVQKHRFFCAQPFYGPTLTSIHDYWKNHSFDYTDFCGQSNVSAN